MKKTRFFSAEHLTIPIVQADVCIEVIGSKATFEQVPGRWLGATGELIIVGFLVGYTNKKPCIIWYNYTLYMYILMG